MDLNKFYSKIFINDGHILLKSYRYKQLLTKLKIPVDDIAGLKKALSQQPCNMFISLSPQEIIFKNIKLPFIEDKLIEKVIHFEKNKYFNLKTEDLVFGYKTWKKEDKESWITLFCIKKIIINKFLPVFMAGFIPVFYIENYYIQKQGLNIIQNLLKDKILLMAYYNNQLIAWTINEKINLKSNVVSLKNYLTTLSLGNKIKIDFFHSTQFSDYAIDIETEKMKNQINKMIKRRFNKITKFFIAVFFLLLIIFQFSNISIKSNNLNKIKSFLDQNKNINNINRRNKKIDLPTLTLSEIINKITKKLSPDRKIERFIYKENKIKIFIKETDELKLSKLKESLANEPKFAEIIIEEGSEKNDKRILFKIKK